MKILLLLIFSGLVVLGQETAGIGVVLGREGEALVVKGVSPDSPAALSQAIHPGDRITAVAQGEGPAVDVKGFKIEEAVPLLRGPKGTTVRVTIIPAGKDQSQAVVVSFVRGELKALARWGDGKLLVPGTEAPNIQMVDLSDGKIEHLVNYADKIVVLEFWATWCPPCQISMAELQTYPAKYPEWKDKVVLLGASVDEDAEIASKHLKAKGWKKTHNVWVNTEAIKGFHINGIPTAYVIDRKGKVAANGSPAELLAIVNRLIARK